MDEDYEVGNSEQALRVRIEEILAESETYGLDEDVEEVLKDTLDIIQHL